MNLSEAAQLLGISETATPDEAKAAFKKLAVKLHPDVNKSENAEEEFKKINEAYQTFENPPKTTAQSEQDFLHEMFNQAFNQNFGFGNIRFNQQTIFNFRETITFEQSVLGTQIPLNYTANAFCDRCNGNGVEFEETEAACSLCLGEKQRSVYGKMRPCTECQATGKVLHKKNCHKCNGKRTITSKRSITVNVPPGVFSGQTMSLHNGPDVIILGITVTPHPEFRLVEKDIHSVLKISFIESLKGVTKEVNTIYGVKKLKIPPKRRNADKISATKLGVKPNGNHVFTLDVELPDDIDTLVEFLEKEKQDGF